MTMCEKITVKAADSYEKEEYEYDYENFYAKSVSFKKVMGFRTMIRPERGESTISVARIFFRLPYP